MIESLINPKRMTKGPLKMLPIGILYSSLSLLLVKLFFGGDPILSKYSGILVVTFTVMFTFPFMYFIIKQKEKTDESINGIRDVWRTHKDAIYSFVWLFVGYIIGFSFWYILLGSTNMLNAQIESYCMINSPGNIADCVSQYSMKNAIGIASSVTGNVTGIGRFLSILENNIYVMIFTLIFSLIFGAGAIFILAWNATVIASAIGIFTNYKIVEIPLGFVRYMIHGIPEIGSYFITSLAGGILGIGIIRHGIKDKRFYHVLENVILLLFISIVILFISAIIEVYITPLFT